LVRKPESHEGAGIEREEPQVEKTRK